MKPATTNPTILALDVGGRRIGVARAHTLARLPQPLTTILNDQQVFENLQKLAVDEQAVAIVIGLPRGLNGQETAQTQSTRSFCSKLKQQLNLPVYLQDEALTSQKAEKELSASGERPDKAMIDALAATYILEDFLRQEKPLRQDDL